MKVSLFASPDVTRAVSVKPFYTPRAAAPPVMGGNRRTGSAKVRVSFFANPL
jgi:hypothetical protein